MQRPDYWASIIKKVVVLYTPFLVVGALLGYWQEALIIACIYHIFWFYRYQKRLQDWLWNDRSLIPPQGPGTWELIFNGIYRLQQRHRARRRELAAVIRRFREGAEALPDAAVVCRNDGSIIWCNRLASQCLGFRWPEDSGQNISNLIRTPAFVSFLQLREFTEPLVMPSPVNDDKILEARVMPYAEDQFMLVVRDVTHIKSIENMRKNFVANVSHELRTPLTVLKGYLEMLEDELPPPVRWKKMQQVMLEQTMRMDNLVDQLLTLSRIEVATDIDRTRIVDVPKMLLMLQHEAKALSGSMRHDIIFQTDPDLKIYGDEDQLRSAMTNLVNNAIKYTPAGRKITVEWYRDGAQARFAVTDEGEGIALEHLGRLTDRFYRVDKARSRQTGGSGLGLAIVKHALSHHDSLLNIESTAGKGSCFSFRIPESLVVKG
ncbi:phosphate regulon sensor histidine kinase PhoR [Tolumonas osonensis]|uniref:Phosphate regulon sensor protein PhoR n=1 Tax=Tolumonas osonensis TaxID=675874 RepID=A0A841GAE5_9GAMM|nr:phosphate regulon sensor histidine kinase PhoR [Tolumonas osonensis]MBB6056028.1 two-component system phosphate regulon sensor histidine kinase PhoR [Tolumonas osonensis]